MISGEEHPRDQVAEMQGRGGEVTGGGAEGEGGHDRGPVEGFSAAACRCCGSRGSSRWSTRRRRRRPGRRRRTTVETIVGDAELDVQHVGGHRAEDGRPSPPPASRSRPRNGAPQLGQERHGRGRCAPRATATSAGQSFDEVVRGRLPHGRRQHLDDPEVGGEFGNLPHGPSSDGASHERPAPGVGGAGARWTRPL